MIYINAQLNERGMVAGYLPHHAKGTVAIHTMGFISATSLEDKLHVYAGG